ncbi:MAG: hypothetical protein WCJ19_05950 [bacterium]
MDETITIGDSNNLKVEQETQKKSQTVIHIENKISQLLEASSLDNQLNLEGKNDNFDEEDKVVAEKTKNKLIQNLAKIVSKSKVQESHFNNYVELLFNSGKLLSVSKEPNDILKLMKMFAYAGPDLDKAILYNTFASEWVKKFINPIVESDKKLAQSRVTEFQEIMENLTKYTNKSNPFLSKQTTPLPLN